MCTPTSGRQMDGTVRPDFRAARRQDDIRKKNWNLADDYGPKNEILPGGNSTPTSPFGGRPTQTIDVGVLMGRQNEVIPPPPAPPSLESPQPPPPPANPTPPPPPRPVMQPSVANPNPQSNPNAGLMIDSNGVKSRRRPQQSNRPRSSRSNSIGVNTNNSGSPSSIGLNIPT